MPFGVRSKTNTPPPLYFGGNTVFYLYQVLLGRELPILVFCIIM